MKITVEIDYELKGVEHHVWERFGGSKAAIEWLENVESDVLTKENEEEEKKIEEDARFEGEMEQRELDGLETKEE